MSGPDNWELCQWYQFSRETLLYPSNDIRLGPRREIAVIFPHLRAIFSESCLKWSILILAGGIIKEMEQKMARLSCIFIRSSHPYLTRTMHFEILSFSAWTISWISGVTIRWYWAGLQPLHKSVLTTWVTKEKMGSQLVSYHNVTYMIRVHVNSLSLSGLQVFATCWRSYQRTRETIHVKGFDWLLNIRSIYLFLIRKVLWTCNYCSKKVGYMSQIRTYQIEVLSHVWRVQGLYYIHLHIWIRWVTIPLFCSHPAAG